MKSKWIYAFWVAVVFASLMFTRCNPVSSQRYIDSDTLITKSIRVGKSFELKFDHCPGAGYSWQLQPGYDTTAVAIQFVSSEVKEGNHPVGGHYILTDRLTVLKKDTVTLVYRYCRPWEKEYVFECRVRIKGR